MLDLVEASVRTDEHRQEVRDTRQTSADALRSEGRQEGALGAKQETLIRPLRRRFGEPSPTVIGIIESTADVGRLDAWLERFATAKKLSDVGIGADA
jgi:hypothetical protein